MLATPLLQTLSCTMNYETGLAAIRLLKSLALSRNDPQAAVAYASGMREHWGRDADLVVEHVRAPVSDVGTSDIGGGSSLQLDFMAATHPGSVFGALRPLMHRVKPNMPLLTQVGPPRAFWVGESKARRLSAGHYVRDPGLSPKGVAATTVCTKEMITDPGWEADKSILKSFVRAAEEARDRSFLDPLNSGSATTPASITSTVNAIVSGGTTAAAISYDLETAVWQLAALGSDLVSARLLMTPSMGATLGLMRGSGGDLAFPKMGALGGEIAGIPAICSGAAESEANSDGFGNIVLVDASAITYVELPPILKVSEEATIEMSDTPAGASDTPTASSVNLVSCFQEDLVALQALLRINWQLRRPMVAMIKDIAMPPLES